MCQLCTSIFFYICANAYTILVTWINNNQIWRQLFYNMLRSDYIHTVTVTTGQLMLGHPLYEKELDTCTKAKLFGFCKVFRLTHSGLFFHKSLRYLRWHDLHQTVGGWVLSWNHRKEVRSLKVWNLAHASWISPDQVFSIGLKTEEPIVSF